MSFPKVGRVFQNEYELLQRIGSGAQGVVWKAKKLSSASSSSSPEIIAIKIIDIAPLNEKQKELALTEVRVLSMMSQEDHQCNNCIMKYLDSFLTEEDELCLVLEWAEGGTLGDWLRKRKDFIDAKTERKQKTNSVKTRKNPISPLLSRFIWHILISVTCALDQCATRKILHRDLKPENIFLADFSPPTFFEDEDEFIEMVDDNDNVGDGGEKVKRKHNAAAGGVATTFPRCLLGDFGVSCVLDQKTSASTMIGSPYFLCPSICKGEKYDFKADIWSLGVCGFLCVNNNRYPFEASNYAALILQIVSSRMADHDVNAFTALTNGNSTSETNNKPSSSSSSSSNSSTKMLMRLQKSPTYQLRDFVDSCLIKSAHLRPTAADLLTRRFTILMASQLGLMKLYPVKTKAIAAKVLDQVHQDRLNKMVATTDENHDDDNNESQQQRQKHNYESPIKNVGRRRSFDQKNLQQHHDQEAEKRELLKLLPSSAVPVVAPTNSASSFVKTSSNSNQSQQQQQKQRPARTNNAMRTNNSSFSGEPISAAVNGGNKFGVIKTKRMIQQERINSRVGKNQNQPVTVVDLSSTSSNLQQQQQDSSPTKWRKPPSTAVTRLKKHQPSKSYAEIHMGSPTSKDRQPQQQQRKQQKETHQQQQPISSSSLSKIKSTKADRQSVQDLPTSGLARDDDSNSSTDDTDDDNDNNGNKTVVSSGGGWGAPLDQTNDFAKHTNVTASTSAATTLTSEALSMQANAPSSSNDNHQDYYDNEDEEKFQMDDDEEYDEEADDGDTAELEPFGSTIVNVSWRVRDEDEDIVDNDDEDEDDRQSIMSAFSLGSSTSRVNSGDDDGSSDKNNAGAGRAAISNTTTEHYEDTMSLATQVDLCNSEGCELVGQKTFEKLIEIVRNSKNGNEIEKSIEKLEGADDSAKCSKRIKDAVHCAYRMCLLDAVKISEKKQ